jgi:formate dehydrogenase alpha subunit
VAGLAAAFGSGAMTNSIDDLGQADVVLVIGSNTTEAHPIIGIELKKAARRGTRIFVVDPRQIRLTRHSEKWLPVEPGANVALINAMMRIIIEEGLADDEFISARTEGFEAVRALVGDYDLDRAAATCGVSVDDIRELALAYASAERAAIVYAMGVTQHESGTQQVRALANLAMLTGNIGRPGTGVNPLRGQNNVQGACDLACLPDCLPGYQKLGTAGTLDRFCDFWETERVLPDESGLTLVEMMDAVLAGDLKAMYVMGENPVIADPDQAHVLEALEALDFLVVQDIFMTETASLADVVLPAASFLEKDGTFTNTDRRIKRARKVIDSPGAALTDGEIIVRLSHLLGIDDEYASPSEVMIEMSSVTPQYGGVSYRRLEAEGEIRWPCPDDDHPGTAILHAERFTRGLGEFAPVDYLPPAEKTDADRPLILTTGRHLWNFHTNTMTSRTAGLSTLNDHGYVEMNPADAGVLGICNGDSVEVTSAHGSVVAEARVEREGSPKRGVVFMPFHFADAPANRLTGSNLDPTAKIPGLKVTAVQVRKVDS